MTVWSVALLPLLSGLGLWALGRRPSRGLLGAVGVGVLLADAGLGGWAGLARPAGVVRWGAGLELHAGLDATAAVMVVLVPLIAAPIVAFAAAAEEARGLVRLVGLLVAFVGGMQLLVLAADLLTLLIAWELVGACSWGLIAHHWRDAGNVGGAAHAFLVTRIGDLGLFVAAGAALAGTGSLAYADLTRLDGAGLGVFVAGVGVAALAKSGQVPFSPWLFSAMGGPSPVSALLHAATMVAAGAYLLARLEPVLAAVAWFGPAALALGLVTALAGGVVASLQDDAKKVLAASTSAHYGLMIAAVGAGYPSAALAHLVAHAAFKAALFLAAGIGMEAVGSRLLARMRLGSALPVVGALTVVASLALGGVPPLGGAFTKEKVIAATGHAGVLWAVAALVAGGLSALYAARFCLLAYGPTRRPAPRLLRPPGAVEVGALAVLAVASAGLGVFWVPAAQPLAAEALGGELPSGAAWELAGSLALVALGVYAALVARRAGRLATLGLPVGLRVGLSDWLGLPRATKTVAVDPGLAACHALARFDDRVVDAGVRGAGAVGAFLSDLFRREDVRSLDGLVRGVAAVGTALARALTAVAERLVDGTVELIGSGVGAAGRDTRRLQTGLAHHYLLLATVGVVALVTAAVLGR